MRRSGAMLEGHFTLSSGLHSGRYFQCALLFEDPHVGRRLTEALAQTVQRAGAVPDKVVGVALGGMLVGHELAAALRVPSVFVERSEGKMALRRGFQIKPGERVLIAEDVVTTGGSSSEAAEVVHRLGGNVIGQAALLHRTLGPLALNVPLYSLLEIDVESWPAEQCPLCRRGMPISKPGSR